MHLRFSPLTSAIKTGLMASVLAINPVWISNAQADGHSHGASQLSQSFDYQIPAGSLSDALVKLGGSSQVLLTFDPQLVQGKTTIGLKGQYSLEQGLKALLQGKNLSYQVVSKGAIKIVPAGLAQDQSQLEQQSELQLQEEMVITATRTEHLVRTAPASVSVISGEEIRSKPIADFSELVRREVGINVNQSQATGRKDIQIRGMDAQYTLLLIDGRRTSSSEALIRGNDFDLSTLPVESIERIEVIRGPMSALYGSDALGGVINIITRKADQKWQTSVKLSAETPVEGKDGETFKQSLFTAGPVNERLSLSFALENSNRDGWKDIDEDPATDIKEKELDLIESQDQLNARLGLDYELDERQSLSLDIGYSDDSRFTRYESWGWESFADQDSQRLSLAAGYQLAFNDQWQGEVNLGHESIDLSDETSVYAVKESEQDNLTFNSAVTHFGERSITTLGADVVKTTVDGDTDWVKSESVKQLALFAQSEIELSNDLSLTLGGRVDDHDFFGTEFSPRAYLVFTPMAGLVLKGGYSEAFNAPSLFQLSKDYRVISCGGGCYLTGNEDLKPETAKNVEAAISYSTERWNVGLTYFNNKVDNLVERNFVDRHDIGQDLPAIYYENVSEASFDGWEFVAGSQLTDTLSVQFNFSTIDAVNEETKQDLTSRPEHSANLALNWSPNDDSSYFVQLRHIGAMLNSWSVEVPAYEVVDLGGQYQINNGWKLSAGVNNLLDQRLDQENEDYEQVLVGRSVYLSSQWQF